jgi:putative flavoprotein involved in K+ transport
MHASSHGPRVVTTVVVGAGHAGLAMSACLSARGIDHVLLERGAVANSWRQRWDSLRLLTPNWQCRLPGYAYCGDDPDGFMTKSEVAAFIERYAAITSAPVQTNTTVTSVSSRDEGYRVSTDCGEWQARTVVIASGAFARAAIPPSADGLSSSIVRMSAADYRNPNDLPAGGVLVVGASATGVQIADEIHRSGRPVTLAVGEHVRMPRRYRGFDIQRWLEHAGIADQRYDEVDDLVRARRVPSPQLVGTPQHATLDLNALTDSGVRLVGRFAGARDTRIAFAGSLRNVCALADLKLGRLLDTIDDWAERNDAGAPIGAPERFAATRIDDAPSLGVDCQRTGIRSVVWATGFKPDYGWLHVPAFDRKGGLRHDGGIVDVPGVAMPGLYAMGLTFMRRRKSSFIHGAEDDAAELADHLVASLDCGRAARNGAQRVSH